jgi:deoxyribonuclease V
MTAREYGVIGCFDVAYGGSSAVVGCLTLNSFTDAVPSAEWAVDVASVAPYVPGEFWRRELAPLLAGIAAAPYELSVCVLDAYVDLGSDRKPGLGRLLFEQFGVPVIGVAKTRFFDTPAEYEVLRGSSRRPLFVSTAGFDLDEAKESVGRMAGVGRVPTMLRRVDLLSRSANTPATTPASSTGDDEPFRTREPSPRSSISPLKNRSATNR